MKFIRNSSICIYHCAFSIYDQQKLYHSHKILC